MKDEGSQGWKISWIICILEARCVKVIQTNQVAGRVIPVQTFFLDIYRQLGRIYGKLILDNFTVLVWPPQDGPQAKLSQS